VKSGIVGTHNDSICHIGFRDNPPTIRIYKDIEMNLNRILFLTNPTHPHEAVCKTHDFSSMQNMIEIQSNVVSDDDWSHVQNEGPTTFNILANIM